MLRAPWLPLGLLTSGLAPAAGKCGCASQAQLCGVQTAGSRPLYRRRLCVDAMHASICCAAWQLPRLPLHSRTTAAHAPLEATGLSTHNTCADTPLALHTPLLPTAEGVLYAEKDYNLPKHPEIDVPNLEVIKLMQSFKSKEYVTERYAWRHFYWCAEVFFSTRGAVVTVRPENRALTRVFDRRFAGSSRTAALSTCASS